jgi:hypothetical protein
MLNLRKLSSTTFAPKLCAAALGALLTSVCGFANAESPSLPDPRFIPSWTSGGALPSLTTQNAWPAPQTFGASSLLPWHYNACGLSGNAATFYGPAIECMNGIISVLQELQRRHYVLDDSFDPIAIT